MFAPLLHSPILWQARAQLLDAHEKMIISSENAADQLLAAIRPNLGHPQNLADREALCSKEADRQARLKAWCNELAQSFCDLEVREVRFGMAG